ncbi:hypothetical protein CI610_00135 [invertebrate metagenome]|uniref:Uncharacterized protein n=1 Tax=invertebrate metagenome TaxID=1711999 RepID=A0A2H9TCG5_9ZZZZ
MGEKTSDKFLWSVVTGAFRKSWFQGLKGSAFVFLLIKLASAAHAYNSEEHTLIVDTGFDRLRQVHPEIVDYFPENGMSVIEGHGRLYRMHFVKAKALATGVVELASELQTEGADEVLSPGSAILSRHSEEELLPFLDPDMMPDAYSDSGQTQGNRRAQDKCLWLGYLQQTYNRNIFIPTQVPDSALYVSSFLSDEADLFTPGQLSALYGDMRRTTYCEKGKCFLSHEPIRSIQFPGSNLTSDQWCPRPVDAAEYLRAMASGLVPPMGRVGNTLANFTHVGNYHEAGWWGDELLRLANVNDWHFSNVAVAWYVGLHRLALIHMAKAVDDPAYMVKAMHLEANALHAFVDLFAFGHVVTHRDETSSRIIRWNKLNNHPVYQWSEFVIQSGGGLRNNDGRVTLDADSLSGLIEVKGSGYSMVAVPGLDRNDTMSSYRGPWARRAYNEERYHTVMNNAGAVVRNLNGDRFQMYGDGKLDKTPDVLRIASEGVKASFNSLFLFYEKIKNDELSIDRIDDALLYPDFFPALKRLPVYVEYDRNGYFTGRWTRYADFIDRLTDSRLVPEEWHKCQTAYLSGKDFFWPKKFKQACMLFPDIEPEADSA